MVRVSDSHANGNWGGLFFTKYAVPAITEVVYIIIGDKWWIKQNISNAQCCGEIVIYMLFLWPL